MTKKKEKSLVLKVSDGFGMFGIVCLIIGVAGLWVLPFIYNFLIIALGAENLFFNSESNINTYKSWITTGFVCLVAAFFLRIFREKKSLNGGE